MNFEYRLFNSIDEIDRELAKCWLRLAIYQEFGTEERDK